MWSRRLFGCKALGRSSVRLFATQREAPPRDLEYYLRFQQVVDVRPLAERIRNEVRRYTRKHPLRLVGILASLGDFRQDAELYSQKIERTCMEDSIDFEIWRCQPRNPEEVQKLIHRANEDEDVDGVLVFYPIYPAVKKPTKRRLPGMYYNSYDDFLRSQVSPLKDVEGLRTAKWYNSNLLLSSAIPDDFSAVQPCTSSAVQKVLEQYHFDHDRLDSPSPNTVESWNGQKVSIFNRSKIVGRPLAATLASAGAAVFSIDADSVLRFTSSRVQRCSSSVAECLAESRILVTGIPHEHFHIPLESIKSGSTVVNVSEFAYANEDRFLEREDITYIPRIGAVTVSMLEANLVHLHKQRRSLNLQDPFQSQPQENY